MHLDDAALAKVCAVLRRHVPAGLEVLAFGSRAHGRNVKRFSDLDLCLRGTHTIPAELLENLEAGFRESDLPIKVDVIDWHRVAPDFRAAIAADLVPFPFQSKS